MSSRRQLLAAAASAGALANVDGDSDLLETTDEFQTLDEYQSKELDNVTVVEATDVSCHGWLTSPLANGELGTPTDPVSLQVEFEKYDPEQPDVADRVNIAGFIGGSDHDFEVASVFDLDVQQARELAWKILDHTGGVEGPDA